MTGATTADLIGVGSQIRFTRDIAMGLNRTKTFCDGTENKFALMSPGRCCTIERRQLSRLEQRMTLRAAVPRVVNWVNWRRTRLMIDPVSETTVRCRAHRISAAYLKAAFGDALVVDRVVAPSPLPAGAHVEL